MRMKHVLMAMALLGVAILLHGCGKGQQAQGPTTKTGRGTQTIQIKGSDTMVNLGQAWAEAYGQAHPEVSISVSGGGSGIGIAALINGNTDIAESSRDIKPEELADAKKKGMDPQEFVVAQDGLSVIVNPANPINRITVDQLSDIYAGKVTNWKQLGGRDEKIVVLSRDVSSGTYVFFQEHVIRKGNAKGTEDYAPSVIKLPSSKNIADEVAGNSASIGYVGMGYVEEGKEKALPVARNAKEKFVIPAPENVINRSYPIARPLYLYTPNEPKGSVKDFIDFVLSDDGQRIVADKEFVPIRTVK